jgi:TRAP transporter TAXI family solute receptor
MNRRDLLILSLSTSAVLLMGHTPYRQWQVYRKNRLIFVVSEVDEVSLRLGTSIAQALAARLPQSKAMMATTATAVDVVSLLTSAQLDVALLTSDDVYEAVGGAGKFKGRAVPLRALAVFGSSVLHLVTLAGNGITGVPDLNGRVLASGLPGSPTETLVLRVLEAYGIDPEKDLRRAPLAGERAAAALKEKTVDAIARADMVAGGALRDLVGFPGLALTLLEHGDALPKIGARYGPIYRRGTIPKDAYPGITTDVGAVAVDHLLVCRGDFPDEKAYQIAKTLAEPPGSQPLLPFHPGALLFYEGRSAP